MLKSKENAMAAEELEVVSGGTSQETINFIHELIHDGLEISAGKNKRESAIALAKFLKGYGVRSRLSLNDHEANKYYDAKTGAALTKAEAYDKVLENYRVTSF